MSNQVIPEAAVEAAAKVYQDLLSIGGFSTWDDLDDSGRAIRFGRMRAALAAAWAATEGAGT